jgi:hypothetical protein
MGYVEESGAAQFMRDARILTIYEGTTGIQANDLVGRKILGDSGKAVAELIREIRELDLQSIDESMQQDLSSAVDSLEETVSWLLQNSPSDPHAPGSAAVNTLMLIGTVTGGWQLARSALACRQMLDDGTKRDVDFCRAKMGTAKFYFDLVMPRSIAYARAATAGSESIVSMAVDSL